ncbi:MAG: YceH family protein [Acidobacteria bacterium]|nr:YceH family protein [Acidobacteriota bacterium]
MKFILNEVEIRVLGAMIEKQITLPDYYPLSLNALSNACNQKSSRNPVVAYDEQTVMRALDSLRDKGLAWVFKGADSRVLKYGHVFAKSYELNELEVAVMCVLMLRGAQTPGEIRSRCNPLWNFDNLEEVEATIQGLMEKDTGALIVKLPKQAGTKESRFMHLLGGDVPVDYQEAAPRETATHKPRIEEERLAKLEDEVAALRHALAQLQEQFSDFKKQFE